MRAILDIEATSRKSETLHRPAVDEVLGDNFIYIFELHKAVPDGLGVNHYNRAMLALVEAASLVGTNNMFQTSVFDGILESGFDLLAPPRKATWPGRSFVTLVGANEDVVLKFRHWQISLLCLFAAVNVRPARLSETI